MKAIQRIIGAIRIMSAIKAGAPVPRDGHLFNPNGWLDREDVPNGHHTTLTVYNSKGKHLAGDGVDGDIEEGLVAAARDDADEVLVNCWTEEGRFSWWIPLAPTGKGVE